MEDLATSVVMKQAVVPERRGVFYVVSARKFALLYLGTLGLYSVYWFYRNWNNFRRGWSDLDPAREKIWPLARAIFNIFFVHALLRQIKALGQDLPAVAGWRNDRQANFFVVLIVLSNVLDRMSLRSFGSPYTDLLSLAMLLPLLAQFLAVQKMINLSCDDPSGSANQTLSKANYAWLVLGAICWLLILCGFLLPDN